MKTSTVIFCFIFSIVIGIGLVIIQKPWILERWFPSEETKTQLRTVGKYCSAKSSLEGLIAELPFLEDENLQLTQLEFEKKRMRQCGYPFKQPDNKQQRISFDCNTEFYVKRYNELSEQYMTGESDHE